jgi:hypothetical protein
MASKWRRFEVLLPLQFNDGREVPAEWLGDGGTGILACLEFESAGAYSLTPSKLEWLGGTGMSLTRHSKQTRMSAPPFSRLRHYRALYP